MPIKNLTINKYYKVIGFCDHCPRMFMQKLLALGFIPGAKLYIAKKSLFGSIYQVVINNISLLLRNNDINLIQLSNI